jgi:hypothetical protein
MLLPTKPAFGSGMRLEQSAPCKRISRVFDTRYAVTDPKAYFASGRAEDSILIHRSYAVGSKPRRLPGQLARFASGRVEWDSLFRNMWLGEPHVPEKDKTVPCCRKRIRLPLGKMSGLRINRVTRVIHKNFAFCAKFL